ncbi:hypothetical protein CXG81DRAFT_20011 [Caulochytrium protostelioides]|uniref:Basal body-orientation factor 1 n=1 Tax=Caulochytrium protostelioides TaxID=1555241 RepID=A0A4P9X4H3_9FUNG|nr:hypothetical protein CXG81DRAFT_20011 [Caulochytrium protostelioides]|eukprot:RKO99976.1 hypothetical protein CXG81DRAFT_20011 [Caulochytrium protostelioides]
MAVPGKSARATASASSRAAKAGGSAVSAAFAGAAPSAGASDGLASELPTERELALMREIATFDGIKETFRQRIAALVDENMELRQQSRDDESDALDVIKTLQTEIEQKDAAMASLRESYEAKVRTLQQESATAARLAQSQFESIQSELQEKEQAFRVMQHEVAVIKDFRRKRMELIKELDVQKAELVETDRRHKETVVSLERKFFEEKVRLTKEANARIEELATVAQREALQTLTSSTQQVYLENLKMTSALSYHIEESETLARERAQYERQAKTLAEERVINSEIVKKKVTDSFKKAAEIKDLHAKIVHLEQALHFIVQAYEKERAYLGEGVRAELRQVQAVARGLKQRLDQKTRENRHVCLLAKHLLTQRADMESFFTNALESVRAEIRAQRKADYHAALAAHQKHVRAFVSRRIAAAATAGGKSHAPADPHAHVAAVAAVVASKHPPPAPPSDHVDIADLSWQDKEKLLRVLFAQMNGAALQTLDAPRDGPQRLSTRVGDGVLGAGDGADRIAGIEDDDDGFGYSDDGGDDDGDEDGVGDAVAADDDGAYDHGQAGREGRTSASSHMSQVERPRSSAPLPPTVPHAGMAASPSQTVSPSRAPSAAPVPV